MRTLTALALLLSLSTTTSGQVVTPPADAPGPKVSFKVNNDTGLYASRGVTHVRSKGRMVLDMIVTDSRKNPGRKLQVFVAIYERDVKFPDRFKPGKLVAKSTDATQILSAQGAERLSGPYHQAIELLPGDYSYYALFCDPTLPHEQPGKDQKPPLDLANLPGMLVHAKVCTATVE